MVIIVLDGRRRLLKDLSRFKAQVFSLKTDELVFSHIWRDTLVLQF